MRLMWLEAWAGTPDTQDDGPPSKGKPFVLCPMPYALSSTPSPFYLPLRMPALPRLIPPHLIDATEYCLGQRNTLR